MDIAVLGGGHGACAFAAKARSVRATTGTATIHKAVNTGADILQRTAAMAMTLCEGPESFVKPSQRFRHAG